MTKGNASHHTPHQSERSSGFARLSANAAGEPEEEEEAAEGSDYPPGNVRIMSDAEGSGESTDEPGLACHKTRPTA